MSKVILPIEIIAYINSFLPRPVHPTAKCFHSIIKHFNSDIIDYFNSEKRLNFYVFYFRLRSATYCYKHYHTESLLAELKSLRKELYFVMSQLLLHKNKNPWSYGSKNI
jgi:hypothetical protein